LPSLCTAFHRFVEEIPNFVDTSEVPTNGEENTRYEVIGEPPLLAGAVHDTVAEPLPRIPVTPVGAPGTVLGATDAVTGASSCGLRARAALIGLPAAGAVVEVPTFSTEFA
jgi:hypothetical protein